MGHKLDLETLRGELNKRIAENEVVLKQKEIALKGAKKVLEEKIHRYTLHLRNRDHIKKKTTDLVDFNEYRATSKLLIQAQNEWDDALSKVNELRGAVAHYYGQVQRAMMERVHVENELSEYGQVVSLKKVS